MWRFSNGQPMMFCAECLRVHGYPTKDQMRDTEDKIMGYQAVTISGGEALCAMHFSSKDIVERTTLKKVPA